MQLHQLKLQHFRNITMADLQWNKTFNIIWGDNGQGKTNVLEAIYLLAHLKSFRQVRSPELIELTHDNALLIGQTEKEGVKNQLQIKILKQGSIARINGKQVGTFSEFLGQLRAVLFTPEELATLKGSPAGRRTLLDRAVLQTQPRYLETYQNYQRVLKQRNSLLRSEAPDNLLDPWTEALIESGSRLRRDRLTFLERLKPCFKDIYQKICSDNEEVDIRYSLREQNEQQLTRDMQEDIHKNRNREKQLGQTLCGPHRDDLQFFINQKPLRIYGSQGQQRSVLLAFKAAQIRDQQQLFGEPPLLLLDDLASELDRQRQAGFIEFLHQQPGQVFLTTVNPHVIDKKINRQANYYRVNCGKVITQFP